MKIKFLIPAGLLFATIVVSHFSGNDKAPFFVLIVVGLNILISFIGVIALLMKKINIINFLSLLLPTIYFFLILFLAKLDLIDPFLFLGFR